MSSYRITLRDLFNVERGELLQWRDVAVFVLLSKLLQLQFLPVAMHVLR